MQQKLKIAHEQRLKDKLSRVRVRTDRRVKMIFTAPQTDQSVWRLFQSDIADIIFKYSVTKLCVHLFYLVLLVRYTLLSVRTEELSNL